VVMNDGKIEQQGTPSEVYDNPATPFVFDFLGNVNLFQGRLSEGVAQTGAGEGKVPAVGYVRSHDIEIERMAQDDNSVPAEVRYILSVGPLVRVDLALPGTADSIEVDLSRDVAERLQLQVVEQVFARPRKMHVFTEDYQI
jgi:sulfate/thiosulfate transport system ATP-binding protein